MSQTAIHSSSQRVLPAHGPQPPKPTIPLQTALTKIENKYSKLKFGRGSKMSKMANIRDTLVNNAT